MLTFDTPYAIRGLFNFLVDHFADAAVRPVLLSPVAFVNGTLKVRRVARSSVRHSLSCSSLMAASSFADA